MNNLTKIEYSKQIVITTEQLADVYECDPNNIKKNFSNNQDKFAEGVHYFKVEGEPLRKLRVNISDLQISPMARSLMLWTRRGASRHCKMIGTEKAWEMFDDLEESYFKQKPNIFQLPQNFAEALRLAADQAEQIEFQKKELAEAKPKVEFFDAVAGSNDAIEIGSVAKVLGIKGMGRNNLFAFLRDKKILMNNNQPYQTYVDRGYFRVLEQKFDKPNGETCINIKTLVYQSGVEFIRRQLQQDERQAG